MLLEIVKYLTTPCSRKARSMGYLKEAIGLEARHKRCLLTWASHLDASRALMMQAAGMCASKNRVVVLGSGGLFDIPLGQLSAMFEAVTLVDILHLRNVRRVVSGYSNVTLLEQDLTESGSWPHADLTISANLVSQLPVIPLEHAARSGGTVDGKAMIESHLAALVKCPGTVCLMTETEHAVMAGDTIISRSDPLLGAKIPEQMGSPCQSWHWHFAPHPERHKDDDFRYRIDGFIRT